MANKRTLTRNITNICSALFAECVALSLYENSVDKRNIETLITSVVRLQSDYVCRVSHIEPGMKAKKYFKVLINHFNEELEAIVDQLNNIN